VFGDGPIFTIHVVDSFRFESLRTRISFLQRRERTHAPLYRVPYRLFFSAACRADPTQPAAGKAIAAAAAQPANYVAADGDNPVLPE